MLSEADIIRLFFTHPARNAVLGVGDDAALVAVAPDMELAVSTDMLVEGRHFFADAEPEKLGCKALAVNLSDMAAMGANPRWATLALALPRADKNWLGAFARGFMQLAREHSVDLIGGDTSRGPLNICVQIMGEAPPGQALRRDGAKAGDDIWVSGTLGDAALALAHLQMKIALEPEEFDRCSRALHTPVARVELGKRLRGIAHAAIDISDGIVADLGHILERSRVAAVVEFAKVPRSQTLERYLPVARQALLSGGDDYELCFTASPARHERILALSREMDLPLTRIGGIEEGSGLTVSDERGRKLDFEAKGFDHFR